MIGAGRGDQERMPQGVGERSRVTAVHETRMGWVMCLCQHPPITVSLCKRVDFGGCTILLVECHRHAVGVISSILIRILQKR